MNAIDLALAQEWAILPGALGEILAIARRQNDVTPQALEAYRARYAENGERLRIRDGVAIVDIQGPLFKKANLFQAISGASSYSIMARDFQTAVDDPQVTGILLNIDSPGGTVSGTDELATAIFNARGKKPIIAYASGMAASAAYWIASAADTIVLSEASMVGSIGVVMAIEDHRAADERRGIRTIEFVSSRAPGKRPDHDTDAGRAEIQRRVDDLEAVFIGAVARHRGVTPAKVATSYGEGGVEVGANAIKAGMADHLGTFEDAFAMVAGSGQRRPAVRQLPAGRNANQSSASASGDGLSISEAGTHRTHLRAVDESNAVIASDAVAAAKERIRIILTSPEGKAHPAFAEHLAFSTDMSAEAAVEALKAAGPAAVAPKEPTAEENARAFYAAKARGGALGMEEHPEYRNPVMGESDRADMWARVVANTNRNKGR
jgi:signal peptide peptidase SppA